MDDVVVVGCFFWQAPRLRAVEAIATIARIFTIFMIFSPFFKRALRHFGEKKQLKFSFIIKWLCDVHTGSLWNPIIQIGNVMIPHADTPMAGRFTDKGFLIRSVDVNISVISICVIFIQATQP